MDLELFFVSARTNKRHHHLTTSHTHTDRSIVLPLLPLSSVRPFSNGIFRSNDAPASLPPASSSLAHARRTDGFCNQNTDQLGSLAGLSLQTVYLGVVECVSASLPPASSSLTHAHRMDGFCNQNSNQLCSLAGPPLILSSIVVNAAGGHKDLGVSSKFKNDSNGYSIATSPVIVKHLNVSHSWMVNSVSGLKVDISYSQWPWTMVTL